MKRIKLLFIAALAAVGIGLSAWAAQPVLYSLVFGGTNNIPCGTAATVPITWTMPACLFSNQSNTVEFTNFDAEFQSQFTVYLSASPTTNMISATANSVGTYMFNTVVSPDGVLWVPGPALVMPIAATATNGVVQTLVTNLTATTYRYWGVTNITATVTNAYTTNSSLSIKVFYKTP